MGSSTCGPPAAVLPNPPPALKQGTASATINQYRPQEITAKHNEASDPDQMGHSQSEHSSGFTEAVSTELSPEILRKQQAKSKSSAYQGREKEKCKVKFDESLMQVSMSQSSQEANAAQIADTEQPLDLYNCPLSQREIEVNREKSSIKLCDEASNKNKYFKAGRNISSLSQPAVAKYQAGIESHAELLSRADSESEKLPVGKELPHSISNPCILPRPPVLPGIRPVGALSLLDLQDSFSKSEAHRNFNSSITRAAVNPRDNVVTGKKHDFYGINCFYLHG